MVSFSAPDLLGDVDTWRLLNLATAAGPFIIAIVKASLKWLLLIDASWPTTTSATYEELKAIIPVP